MECNFCKKEFKSVSALNVHQKTAKYCLKIQGSLEKSQTLECEYCNKTFTSKHYLNSHMNSCESYKIYLEIQLLKDEHQQQIIQLKDEHRQQIIQLNDEHQQQIIQLNDEHRQQIIQSKEEHLQQIIKSKEDHITEIHTRDILIAELRAELKLASEDRKTLRDIALQPKTTNTTTNTTTNKILNMKVLSFDKAKVSKLIDEKFTYNHIIDGQEGLARFTVDTVLKDENDETLNLCCTDPSRRIFKYKNENGEIEKDVQGKKITSLLLESGIKNANNKQFEKYYMDEEGNMDHFKFDLLFKKKIEIDNIDSDNSIFVNALSAITAI